MVRDSPKLLAVGAFLAGGVLISGILLGPAPTGEASPAHPAGRAFQPAISALYNVQGGAVAFSSALGPNTSIPTEDALTFYLAGQTSSGSSDQMPNGSMGGILKSTAQTCQSGKAKGTVFFDWPTGGGSTANLRLTL